MEKYTNNGGNILISGAYIGSKITKAKVAAKRLGNLLKFKWETDFAVKSGQFYSVSDGLNPVYTLELRFVQP